MTTQGVNELSSFFSQSATRAAGQSTKAASETSFSQVMSQAGGNGKSTEYAEDRKVERASKNEGYQGRSSEVVNEPSRPDGGQKTDANLESKNLDRDMAKSKVEDATTQIKGDIKDSLDVTDEDIENAMETLGLTMFDLFDSNALKELYTELSGAENAVSLLTDENLYAGLNEILATASELADELKELLGLGDEDFSSLMQQLSQLDESVAPSSEVAGQLIESGEKTDSNKETLAVSEEPNVKLIDERTGADRASGKVREEVAASDTAEKPATELMDEKALKLEERRDQNTASDFTGGNFGQNQLADAQQVNEAPVDMAFSYTSPEAAREITRQIVDQIQVHITNEATQLEMELNPASLGKVGLAIEAKNGVITAQFTAQNEAVRAAIEGQIQLLQENLEKQGVKVEAVEVTIASHEFEQNLEKGNQQERGQEEEAQRLQRISGRRARNINLLDEEDDEQEELTEEDRINRDMMIRNGNQVDYTA